MFTIACCGVGAYAKCTDWGYKPWTGAAAANLHQTCTRMVRADYCADGNSFTTTGHGIDVDDYFGHTGGSVVQSYGSAPTDTSYGWEASWNLNGAIFIEQGYRSGSNQAPSAYDGTPVNAYINSRSAYCNPQDPFSGPGNTTASFSNGILLTNKTLH